MTKAQLQGVLWDMDGTLVDTEPYWYKAEIELLKEFGLAWSSQQSEALVGNALPLSARVLQDTGVTLAIREIIDRLVKSVVQQVRQQIPWRPGATDLLMQLRAAAVPCALVTMSEVSLVSEVLAQLPGDTFSVQITGESVQNGKPEPEPYLAAIEMLWEQTGDDGSPRTDNFLAVEDSWPGVTSSLSAGLTTIGVPNIVPLAPQPGLTIWSSLAGKTVGDLEQVLVASQNTTVVP